MTTKQGSLGEPPRFPGCSAAILAGGRSTRMGTDKALLEVGGAVILRRTADLLRPLVGDLFVVADNAEAYAPLGLPVVPDRVPDRGSLGGILTAVARAAQPRVLCVACDMPLLQPGVLALLLAAAGPEADAVIPRPAGRPEPLCAVYGRALLPALEQAVAAGRLRIMDALAGAQLRFVEAAELAPVDPNLRSFLNVNTPDELAAARALAARGETR